MNTNEDLEKLRAAADVKRANFLLAAGVTGIWFVAFILSVVALHLTSGSVIAVVLGGISMTLTLIFALLMALSFTEAQGASHEAYAPRRKTVIAETK